MGRGVTIAHRSKDVITWFGQKLLETRQPHMRAQPRTCDAMPARPTAELVTLKAYSERTDGPEIVARVRMRQVQDPSGAARPEASIAVAPLYRLTTAFYALSFLALLGTQILQRGPYLRWLANVSVTLDVALALGVLPFLASTTVRGSRGERASARVAESPLPWPRWAPW